MKESLETYENNETKQIVLYFKSDELEALKPRLESAKSKLEVTTNSELFLKLIEFTEL